MLLSRVCELVACEASCAPKPSALNCSPATYHHHADVDTEHTSLSSVDAQPESTDLRR